MWLQSPSSGCWLLPASSPSATTILLKVVREDLLVQLAGVLKHTVAVRVYGLHEILVAVSEPKPLDKEALGTAGKSVVGCRDKERLGKDRCNRCDDGTNRCLEKVSIPEKRSGKDVKRWALELNQVGHSNRVGLSSRVFFPEVAATLERLDLVDSRVGPVLTLHGLVGDRFVEDKQIGVCVRLV